MSYWMLTDGTNVVSLMPEWNYKVEDKKIEAVHRTRAGNQYRYIWGNYKRRAFDVDFLTSADMTQVNSWWGANVMLTLFDSSSAMVMSGYLVNAAAPIGEFIKPYTDLFGGKIELESA